MTREEAIINLGIIREEMYDEEYGEQTLDSIEFQESLDMAISALKGGWIPVSKRLPEEGHVVYCQLTDGSHAVLYVQDNWGQMEWVDGMMGTGTYDVIAWRELPENYKGESEDTE